MLYAALSYGHIYMGHYHLDLVSDPSTRVPTGRVQKPALKSAKNAGQEISMGKVGYFSSADNDMNAKTHRV
jgi:hypothetical protein